jgi:hypothetical protein
MSPSMSHFSGINWRWPIDPCRKLRRHSNIIRQSEAFFWRAVRAPLALALVVDNSYQWSVYREKRFGWKLRAVGDRIVTLIKGSRGAGTEQLALLANPPTDHGCLIA